MLTSSIHLASRLPAALDKTDGHPFGMYMAMAVIVLVAAAALFLLAFADRATSRRSKTPPVYPILEPPHGRDKPSE